MKFSSQQILKSECFSLMTKTNFYCMKTQVLLHNICIRILSAPDMDPNQLFGSGTGNKVRILSGQDPQQCSTGRQKISRECTFIETFL